MICSLLGMLSAVKGFLAWSLPYECSWIVFRRVSWCIDSIVEGACELGRSAFAWFFEFLFPQRPDPRAADPLLNDYPVVWFRCINGGTEWRLHLLRADELKLAFWVNYWEEREAVAIAHRANELIQTQFPDPASALDECLKGCREKEFYHHTPSPRGGSRPPGPPRKRWGAPAPPDPPEKGILSPQRFRGVRGGGSPPGGRGGGGDKIPFP